MHAPLPLCVGRHLGLLLEVLRPDRPFFELPGVSQQTPLCLPMLTLSRIADRQRRPLACPSSFMRGQSFKIRYNINKIEVTDALEPVLLLK